MKQNNRTIMKKIFGYITLAMALTACGSDEALQEYEQKQDKYPLQFTATVEDIQTRVTADNNWSDGDEIGIQIGTSEDQQGKYTYAANDGSGTWSSENPVSWKKDQTADVTAWYPYDKKENADISNQADGYTQYEFLKAEATGQSSQQTVNLTFKHQMAKVMCRVKDAGGAYIKGAKVRFYGMPSVTFDKGAVTATGTRGEITPYIDEGTYTTYVALLAPQTIAKEQSFIEVTANGKTYHFKPTDNIELKAGKSHNYKITIGDKVDYAIDDNGTYHVRTAEGLTAWAKAANASPYNASCILETNIELTGENNWEPVCQSRDNPYTGTFDGNGKSISGLKINSTNESPVGFISRLGEGGAVKNLKVEGADMSSTSSSANIGAVAGRNEGTISNCHVINTTISGKYQAGGVVGYNSHEISYCHVSDDCSVKVESNVYLGGIAGNNASGAITACYALCSLGVTGDASVGGIFGISTGSCTACYSRCTLSKAPTYAGGISGYTPGKVNACYWANVSGAAYEFEKGINNGTDKTIKVDGTDGKTWADAMEGMNSALTQAGYTDYQYKANGSSQTEPLKLVKKQ